MNTKQKITAIIFILLAIMLQTGFIIPYFKSGTIPSILVVTAVYFTYSYGFENVWKWVFMTGIFVDLLTFSWLGVNALALIMVAAVSSMLSKRFMILHYQWRILIITVLMIFGTLVNEIILTFFPNFFMFLKAEPTYNQVFSWHWLWLKIIYNLLFFTVLFWPFKKIEKIVIFYGEQIIKKKHV